MGGMGGRDRSRSPMGGGWDGGSGVSPASQAAASQLGLDDKALQALGTLNAMQQRELLAQVNPEVCRNPSAVVCKKVQEIKKPGPSMSMGGLGGMMQPMQGMMGMQKPMMGMMDPTSEGSLMMFFSRHPMIDEKAGYVLSQLAPAERYIVMGLIDAHPMCQNPSAVLMSKIKLVNTDKNAAKLEFLKKALDPKAMEALNSQTPEIQHMVLSTVEPHTCKNLSAVVMSGIKKQGGEASPMMTPRQSLFNQQEAVAGDPDSIRAILDQRALTALSELSEEEQNTVLNLIDPQVCRNPSAVTLAKIRDIKKQRI